MPMSSGNIKCTASGIKCPTLSVKSIRTFPDDRKFITSHLDQNAIVRSLLKYTLFFNKIHRSVGNNKFLPQGCVGSSQRFSNEEQNILRATVASCVQVLQAAQCVDGWTSHGMELQEDNIQLNEDDSVQNDSGFGSCGFYFSSEDDFERLRSNADELTQSGFYFSSMDSKSAQRLLKKTVIGTFFIRDSSDSRYLYSMSFKTQRGATSVRILYNDGVFHFDSDERIRHKVPKFKSVMSLIDFHVQMSKDKRNQSWRWQGGGNKNMTVVLSQPLKNSVSSLAHLARVKINSFLRHDKYSIDDLPLSFENKSFIQAYPYSI